MDSGGEDQISANKCEVYTHTCTHADTHTHALTHTKFGMRNRSELEKTCNFVQAIIQRESDFHFKCLLEAGSYEFLHPSEIGTMIMIPVYHSKYNRAAQWL